MVKPKKTDIEGIAAEYLWGQHVVVFSHGFGVDMTDRGLFAEIAANLPKGCGYVMFDYNARKGKKVALSDFGEQARRLRTIINWVRQQAGVKSLSIVSHSLGGVIVALACPSSPQKVIMLAPPLNLSKRTKQYFTEKPGAKFKKGLWHVPRRDGTISLVPETLFNSFEETNAAEVLSSYARQQPFTIIGAGDDEVLKGMPYAKLAEQDSLPFIEVKGANHDFEGPARQELIGIIDQQLSAAIPEARFKKVDKGYGGSVY